MIKFFRKIRQQLLAKNKFTKYLLYAIGEIILVVIGILIALQINNANKKKLAVNKGRDYLREIISDLKADSIGFSKGVYYYKNIVQSKDSLLRLTDFSNTSLESLNDLIVQSYSNYGIVGNTYLKIISAGLTNEMVSKNISTSLNQYYNSYRDFHYEMLDWETSAVKKDEVFWAFGQDKYVDLIFPDTIYNYPIFQSSAQNRINLIKLIKSPRGRNHLIQDIYRKGKMLNNYRDMQKSASELIREIEKELETDRK